MNLRSLLLAAAFAAIAACAQTPRGDAPNAEFAGLDMVDGGYARFPSEEMWCEYRCANFPGRWRADAETELYAAPNINAAVVDRLSVDESVSAVRYERHVRPLRGVVSRAGEGLNVGDVVYALGGDEETTYLWRNGQSYSVTITSDAETYPIAFERTYQDGDFIDWVFVERADGRPNGWLRNPRMPGVEYPIEE